MTGSTLATTTSSTPTSRMRTKRASWTRCCATRDRSRPAARRRMRHGPARSEFAALGWDVTGVDLLGGAARAGTGRRASGPLRAAGHARAGRAGGPFDAITCLFDSIGYALDDAGVVATLAAAAAISPPRRARPRVPARAGTHARRGRAPFAAVPLSDDGDELVRISQTRLDEPRESWKSSSSSSSCARTAPTIAGSSRRRNRFFCVAEM